MNRVREIAYRSAKDEYYDYCIYYSLSNSPIINPKIRTKLKKMAEDEYRHYLFWSSYVDNYKPTISNFKILLIRLITLIVGITVIIKILERHEEEVIKEYKELVELIEDTKHKEELKKIISEEEQHEGNLLTSIEESRIKYLGFTVLGLSDALIEIAGIHAGTLGVYTDTFKAGLAGLIAGVAASIAMASAAYNQAKQTNDFGKPSIAAAYTGIGYILTALLLALPYFVLHNILEALIVSLVISLGILAYISLYAHILYNRNFFKELSETTLIILGATFILYIVGEVVGNYFGIHT